MDSMLEFGYQAIRSLFGALLILKNSVFLGFPAFLRIFLENLKDKKFFFQGMIEKLIYCSIIYKSILSDSYLLGSHNLTLILLLIRGAESVSNWKALSRRLLGSNLMDIV